MVNFQILMCFAVIGLVPTKALQDGDGDGTVVKKTCLSENHKFKTSRIVQDKTNELSCQEVCAANDKCLIWRDDGTCNLTVYTLIPSDKISSGIKNCEQDSDNAISCKAKKKGAVLRKGKASEEQDMEACEILCEESMDCILWEFSKKNMCTLFNLIEIEVPSNAIDTFGVRFCSPSTTTTTTATTTTVILPENPECSNYTTLDDTTRSIKYGDGTYDSVKDNYYCDSNKYKHSLSKSPGWVGESWYQMPDGARIPEKSPGDYHCGTWVPGYLKGTHPTTPGESLDNAKFCFDWKIDDCSWSSMGSITNCGNFMVYKLKDVPGCSTRYCYTEEY